MKVFSVVMTLIMNASIATAEPMRVEIFADGEVLPPTIANMEIIAYDLNEITYMRQNAPTFKRGSLEASKNAAYEWLNSKDFQSYKQQVMRVQYPLMLISKYKLSKIPAIVFDKGNYVIYGTTDIELALREWSRFMENTK